MDSMASTNSRSAFEGRSRSRRTRRTAAHNSSSAGQNLFNQIDNASLETILAQLPMADILRCQFVCKKWKAIIRTPSFSVALNVLFDGSRGAWFFMLNFRSPANVVYDMEVKEWRHIRLPILRDVKGSSKTPVASSNGLMLFRIKSRDCSLIVCNPLTGSARTLPTLVTGRIKTIAFYASESSFAVFVLFGKSSSLQMMMFSSFGSGWVPLPFRKISSNNGHVAENNNEGNMDPLELEQMCRINILEWTPMRKMSSGVTKIGSSGQLMVYFMDPSGRVFGYDSNQGTAVLYPKLLPDIEDCGFDLVECGGRILFVVLTDTLYETALLGIWELDTMGEEGQWKLLAVMPPFMSKKYYGMEADINCAGHGNNIMVCLSSELNKLNQVIMYNFTDGNWLELPPCFDQHHGGIEKRFVSAYSFMPNIQDNLI